jgi:hypothetical protein
MGFFDEKTRGQKSPDTVPLKVDLAVSMRPRKRLLHSLSHRGSRFCGLYQTAEAASAVSIRPRKLSQKFLCLPWSLSDRGSHTFPTIISIFSILGEFEAIFETALAHESGP